VPVHVAPQPGRDATASKLEAALVARIGTQRYHLWFQHTAFVPVGKELVVAVANAHTQDWLARTFGDALKAAAEEVFGRPTPVQFAVEDGLTVPEAKPDPADKPAPAATSSLFEPNRPLPPKPKRGKPAEKPIEKPVEPPSGRTEPRAGRRYKSLGDFIVGASNRVAHASAVSVAEEPGLGANPLVLHGPVGTGKTHLLEGVYAGLRKQHTDLRPTLVSAEEFTTRFVQAARFNKQSQFRRQFRDCGALLIDDLHFLATKRLTQEEFLHTFDALLADGRQVVVSMDCHPRLAEELMPELADRLLGGAVWSLMPPDDETRLGILRTKSAGAGPPIPDEVLKYLARSLKGNVRELEGAVHSVRHFARVTGRRVDAGLAREALGDLLRHAVRSVTTADVDAAVCRVLRLSAGTLQSKARSWAVSHPRAIAINLARKHTSATYGEIAKHFGAKTHSTAVAAEKRVRGWVTAATELDLGDRRWAAKDLLDRVERELQK